MRAPLLSVAITAVSFGATPFALSASTSFFSAAVTSAATASPLMICAAIAFSL